MRMANKTNVNANKEAETVEEVKAVDDAPVTEGTDVKVNEEETVPYRKATNKWKVSFPICNTAAFPKGAYRGKKP